MERLTEWLDEGKAVPITLLTGEEIEHEKCIEKLAEYEDLEEKGLLIKLPCKLGDIVYYPFAGKILVKKIICFMVCKNAKITVFFNNPLDEGCELEDFGKTLFLTREEAEEALRKRLEDFERSDSK